MKNILFKYLAARIIVDAHPSSFTFTRPTKNFNLFVDTFIYMAKSDSRWQPIAIGEEIPSEYRADPNICRVDLFDLDWQRPTSDTFDKDDLIEIFFEYGIGRCFEMSLLPELRPVVLILGVDRFRDYFKNPREVFEKAAKRGGAKIVVFDKTEL
jgi:hypothetical protein